MRNKLLVALMLILTLAFAYEFYSKPNAPDFALMFVPIIALLVLRTQTKLMEVNWAKVHEDAAASDFGVSIQMKSFRSMPISERRGTGIGLYPIFSDKFPQSNGKMAHLGFFPLMRASGWADGVVCLPPNLYEKEPIVLFTNNQIEKRSIGELYRIAQARCQGESTRPPSLLSAIYARLLKRKSSPQQLLDQLAAQQGAP